MVIDEKAMIAERDRRVELINKVMEDNGLDAVLFTALAMATFQLPAKFFSNYQLNTRRSYVFCAKGEMPYLIVPTPGQVFHAKKISWLPEDHLLSGDMMAIVKEKLAGHKVVGWYQPEEIPVGVYNVLMSCGVKFVDITKQFTEARRTKSEYEIDLTKKASKMAADSLVHVLSILEPGKSTEQDLIGAAEGYIRAHGGTDSLILCRSQKPHSFISRALPVTIKKDGVFVYSAEVAGEGGYWTQVVRPIFMSRDAQPEAQAILKVSKLAEAAALKVLRPGYKICDLGEAVEAVIKENGYKTGVWCGHGMGPDLGDAVDIGASVKMDIVPGMIITLHPSIVSDTDGLLYGNTFLTTEGDPICLTDYFNDSPYLEDLLAQAKGWEFGY
ncbi:MAG: M24 family metallopeptidase [Clostridia bacterium]|nr:M24 family metallopeptidase [Clostridia bacterium]